MEAPQPSEKKVSYEPQLQGPYVEPGTVHDLSDRRTSIISKEGEIINASGHRDQLQRQYGLLSLCGIALNINSAWIVLGLPIARAAIDLPHTFVFRSLPVPRWHFLAIAGALSAFEMPYIMTGGANGSETFVSQTVDTAFRFSKVGLASAMAVVLLVIVLVITAVQRLLFPDEKKEDAS